MPFLRRDTGSDAMHFQVAPMVDVVFLLLIFFLATTSIGHFEGKMEANLPRVQMEKPKGKPRQLIVKVERDGLVVNDKRMSKDAFISKLKEIISYDPDQYVFIDGSPDVLQKDVIEIFDQCTVAGANVTIVPPAGK
jgi:biopolymer transport protein ExbD